MTKIWLISDTHFGHANIIRYCNRPFQSADEMDAVMIGNWNRLVKPQDHVYHLGDFCFGSATLHRVAAQLPGHLRLILGNHDNQAPIEQYGQWFKKVLAWRLFKPVILTHVPISKESFGKASVNVHGHVHNNPGPKGPYVNVSVEVRDYKPVELDQIIAEAEKLI